MNIEKIKREVEKLDIDLISVTFNRELSKGLVIVNTPVIDEFRLFSRSLHMRTLDENMLMIDIFDLINQIVKKDNIEFFVLLTSTELYINKVYESLFEELKITLFPLLNHNEILENILKDNNINKILLKMYKLYVSSGDIYDFQSYKVEGISEIGDVSIDEIKDVVSESLNNIEYTKMKLEDVITKIKLINII